MSSLALYVLSLILAVFPPGRTWRSETVVPQDAAGARWDDCYYGVTQERQVPDGVDEHGRRKMRTEKRCLNRRGGEWVRMETADEGAARHEVVASALDDAARATDPEAWPEGVDDLERAATSAFGWSMGFQEGAQTGRLRGPVGEVCLADLHPKTLRAFAPPELRKLSDEKLAESVVGRDYEPVRRCFDVGLRVLLAARREAARRCRDRAHTPIEQLTFAMYGTGRFCSTPPPLQWAEERRYGTLAKLRQRTTTTFPSWYRPPFPEG